MEHLPKLYFQQEERLRKYSLACSLHLQAIADGLIILISDQEGNIVSLEEHSIGSFLTEWPFMNLRFKSTTLICDNTRFLFLPKEFVEEQSGSPFASFMPSQMCAQPVQINGTDIFTHYSTSAKVEKVKELFPHAKVLPGANILIAHTLNHAEPAGECLGIHLQQNHFELVYVKDKQFIFYNIFPKTSIADFNFYLLSVVKQFEIKPAEATFLLSGYVPDVAPVYECLGKYTHNIILNAVEEEVLNVLPAGTAFPHSFFLLSESMQCELLAEN